MDTHVQEHIECMPAQVLRAREVCRRTGLSRTTIWRLERRGAFPPRRQLSSIAVGWIEAEIEDWIASRSKPGRAVVRP
jgi:predicted DNA-binding transcriptional regulator AlpA